MKIRFGLVSACLFLLSACSHYSYDFPSADIRRGLNPETTPQYGSIVFYMKFDGNFLDSIFSRTPSNSTGLPTLFSPTFTNSLGARFAGAQKVTIPHDAGLVITSGFTIQAWIKPNSNPVSSTQCIVSKFDTNGFNLCNFTAPANKFGLVTMSASSPDTRAETSFPSLGSWTHVVATANATSGQVYFNGVAQSVLVSGSAIASSVGELAIGARASPGGDNFDGDIDEVAMWNTVLSASEVLELYRQQAP